jgi:hypothetical protein
MVRTVAAMALVLLVAVAAACGGDDSTASDDPDAAATEETLTLFTETAPAEETHGDGTTESPEASGPAPAPGTGTLALDDGRTFAITITSCDIGENASGPTAGTFDVEGTSDQGTTFEFTQFFLNGDWSQSGASIESPNRDQIYVIATAAGDAEPATVAGRSVMWTATFRELDESANSHVYSGEGVLRLTCT